MDLMLSDTVSGLVDDIKATLRTLYGVWNTIYNNLAVLNSVLLKALSNEPIFDTIGWKVTLCLDDSFAHSWHNLNQLHEVVTWNSFQLTGVPSKMLICGISFLLNVFEPISCLVTR